MTNEYSPISDSSRGPALVGWLIIVVFFGGIGGWATFAPLNGAVVANGLVKVEGNRKSVQHLDGGIVKELRVKEGDPVKVGDVMVVLDDSQARAEFEVLSEQYAVLRATEMRLLTELADGVAMALPPDLAANRDGSSIASIWVGQVRQFESRRAARDGQRKVIGEKIHQLESQIEGGEAQVRAFGAQIDSVNAEAESVAPLVEKMLLPRPRLLQLQRTAFGLEGQIAEARANIAKFRQAIGEQELQIAQLGNDHMAEAAKELRDIQARLAEILPKRTSAASVLGRMEIRAPYAGRVVGLTMFSIGGVIQRGEKILDIVPGGTGCRRGHWRRAPRQSCGAAAAGLQAAHPAIAWRRGDTDLGRPPERSEDRGALFRRRGAAKPCSARRLAGSPALPGDARCGADCHRQPHRSRLSGRAACQLF
jgi:HlyD family type I secretion membrane fusion protein